MLAFKKPVPPVWLLPCLILMYALDRWLPVYQWLLPPWHYLGIMPIIISLLITGKAAKTLAASDTTIAPFGEASHLVSSGIYRYSRNPMYLGMSLILLGCAFFFGSITALIPVVLFMLIVQHLYIIPEEQKLSALFGKDYDQFCQQVRRWF